MRENPCGKCCQDRDLQTINAEKRQFGGTMDAEIYNVIYMELYSGPKMAHGNVAGLIDRDSTVERKYDKSPCPKRFWTTPFTDKQVAMVFSDMEVVLMVCVASLGNKKKQ
jgi:hypothetical protein